ncbi:hypothetical protein GCM10017774_42100 [Lentzea cavernae]|uniref:Uncharacterized protein n=1 Tax=Lentzea cavernae TaxID=2020703 RepID=A0ABQ3MID5_9PSEU|nr:hypothetical protein GCM10017774_42100 [Lentzea cavernae]
MAAEAQQTDQPELHHGQHVCVVAGTPLTEVDDVQRQGQRADGVSDSSGPAANPRTGVSITNNLVTNSDDEAEKACRPPVRARQASTAPFPTPCGVSVLSRRG